jgi:hypothetical protein
MDWYCEASYEAMASMERTDGLTLGEVVKSVRLS